MLLATRYEEKEEEEEVNMDMGQGYIDTKQDQLSTEPKQVYSKCSILFLEEQ